MRCVRSAVCVAAEMGADVGERAVLLGRVPDGAACGGAACDGWDGGENGGLILGRGGAIHPRSEAVRHALRVRGPVRLEA